MSAIYHITSRSDWDDAKEVGIYSKSTRNKSFSEVGFIHASTVEQLQATANFVYAERDFELVVLEMDTDTLKLHRIAVIFEDGGNGQLYPHIYSELPTDLVVSVHPEEFISN